MSGSENRKGFSSVSSLESKVDAGEDKPASIINGLSEQDARSSINTSEPPSITKVTPREPDDPVTKFIKEYWIWLIIGAIFLYNVLKSDETPSLTESKPAVGRGLVLNASQIYYCLAEGARIDANKLTMNNYETSSLYKYNFTVDDYNSRCSEYRYKDYSMDLAKKAFNANRYIIESEGRGRL
jgi:hypothetical protein